MGPAFVGTVKLLLALQATQATLVGTVRDAHSGAPLQGSFVELTDLERIVVTDEHGRYAIRGVPAGPQHVTVHLIGYARRTLHALVPREGGLEINVALVPEPIALRTLDVRLHVPVRGLESSDSVTFPDRAVSQAAVRNHPMLAEPDVFQALSGGYVQMGAEAPSGVHIRGGASDHTAYLLDDIPVFSPYHAAGVFSAWNPEALASVGLSSAAPSPLLPHTLSGAVAAVTRTPGMRFNAQGSVSTTQARITIDGPLGAGGVGYLLSLRSAFPSPAAPRREASYLGAEIGDWLGKIEAPALGGRLRILGYESESEIDAAANADVTGATSSSLLRNAFEWRSQSVGVSWTRAFSRISVRVRGWSASSHAAARWALVPDANALLSAVRQDNGVLVALEHHAAAATTAGGFRAEQSRTSYRSAVDSSGGAAWQRDVRMPIATLFLQHERSVRSRGRVALGASVTAAANAVHAGPRAHLGWRAAQPLTVSASYARLHQFAQSLRNGESVVGTVFPVDLFVGTSAQGVPVARSDLGVIAMEYRPVSGLVLGLQAYERALRGLLLVAPREGGPFTTSAFTTGTGAARGLAADVALSSHRIGMLASYGWQRVHLEYSDSSYVPERGAAHLLEAGIIFFPSATASIRLGGTGVLGRRTTKIAGGFEWESCNLLDLGCEFAGSPRHDGEVLGGTRPPAYLRVDVGARKHWHLEIARRDATVTLFATVTNLLARRNVLTYARDASTGELVPIDMRPLAPLVIGIDWRF